MSDDLKKCLFRDVPEGALFIELEGGDFDLTADYHLHEKYSDSQTIVVGGIHKGVAQLCQRPPTRMQPSSDDIYDGMLVALIPEEWMVEARRVLAAARAKGVGASPH